MNVKELIEKLKTCRQDLPVLIMSWGDPEPVSEVKEEEIEDPYDGSERWAVVIGEI